MTGMSFMGLGVVIGLPGGALFGLYNGQLVIGIVAGIVIGLAVGLIGDLLVARRRSR